MMTMRLASVIRSEFGLTQVEFALLLGKSKRTIARWEADEVKLDTEAIRQETKAWLREHDSI